VTTRAHWSRRRVGFVGLTLASTLAALVTNAGAAAPAAPPVAAAVAPTTSPLTAAPSASGTMLVIGDSYSSYYGDRRSRYPGWWALLAADLGLEPQLDATGGTGFLARAGTCTQTRYRARLQTVRATNPKILMIEGGRNDWRRCTADGRVVEATRTQIEKAAEEFFAQLAGTWDRLDRPRADVYVISPWGPVKARKGRIIRPIIHEAAQRHGFSWVETRPLTLAQAPDGTHPDNEGSRFLREQVLRNSDLSQRFTRI
jgi:lysophospholipase L1-like esterase